MVSLGDHVIESAAQITAPESLAQAQPECAHCGAVITLDPRERDCCHRITAEIQAMQLESPRQVGRYVLWLTHRIAALEGRILEIETTPAPAPIQRKAKG